MIIDSTYSDLINFFGNKPEGRILDVPAGKGGLSEEFLKRGFSDITCIDIDEDNFRLKGRVNFLRHDINNPLPFTSETFDYVFSREGIEHLVAPMNFLNELCRALKKGGYLYLTTPNIMSVESRLRFLLTGYFSKFKGLMSDRNGLSKKGYQGHISPIYFWQLVYFLENNGLEIIRVTADTILSGKITKKPINKLFAALIKWNLKRRG